MAARVTGAEVVGVSGLSSENKIAVEMAITVATTIVDEKLAPTGKHSEAALRNLELFLAAHFATLTVKEGPIEMNRIGAVTERYHDIYEAGLNATRFGQQAIVLDTTGTLAGMSAQAIKPRLKALFTVVGDPPDPELDQRHVFP